MKTIVSIALIAFASGCCWNAGSDLNVCAEIDAQTNDAGACTFTPTHPPLNPIPNQDGGTEE